MTKYGRVISIFSQSKNTSDCSLERMDIQVTKDLMRYSKLHKIDIDFDKGKKAYSMDATCSIFPTKVESSRTHGGIPKSLCVKNKFIEKAPNKQNYYLEFKKGDVIKINNKSLSPGRVQIN